MSQYTYVLSRLCNVIQQCCRSCVTVSWWMHNGCRVIIVILEKSTKISSQRVMWAFTFSLPLILELHTFWGNYTVLLQNIQTVPNRPIKSKIIQFQSDLDVSIMAITLKRHPHSSWIYHTFPGIRSTQLYGKMHPKLGHSIVSGF